MSATVRKDVARNRLRLLEAADQAFRERGREASLDDVAKAAGVGVATADRHFENKAALIDALIDDRVSQAAALLENAERGLRAAMEAAGEDRDVAGRFQAALGPSIQRLADRAAGTDRIDPSFAAGDLVVMIWMMGTVTQYAGDQSPDLWRRYLGFLLNGVLREPTGALGEAPPPFDPQVLEGAPHPLPLTGGPQTV